MRNLLICLVCAGCSASTFSSPTDGGTGNGELDAAKDVSAEPDGHDAAAEMDAEPSSSLVNLGSASDYTVLTKAGVSIVTSSTITGDIGISPAASTYLTGFSLMLDSSSRFSTSTLVTGKVYAADYAIPTPADTANAIGDADLAFSDAAGRTATVNELASGNIGGKILVAGVYGWSSNVQIAANVILSGSASDVWIFQIAQDLKMSATARVVLNGGAVAAHVYWQVSGSVDLGTAAHLEGIVLTHTAVTVQTGASVKGRLFAQTAITIAGNAAITP